MKRTRPLIGAKISRSANRSQFYRDVAAGPFYGYNRFDHRSEEDRRPGVGHA
jgi:hypothetical protein